MRAGVLGWMALLAASVALQTYGQTKVAAPQPKVAFEQQQAAMAYSPRQVPTPPYKGMTLPEVRKSLGPPPKVGGPAPLFASVFVASGPPDGVVDTQVPEAGKLVIRGELRLVLYMKAADKTVIQPPPPQKTTQNPVPDLTHDNRQQALIALKQVVMQARFAQPQGDDTWEVVDQNLRPPLQEPPGTVVVVTMGPPVPPLVGLDLNTANAELEDRSLVLRVISGGSKGGPPQTITYQNYAPGTYVRPGTTIDVELPVTAPPGNSVGNGQQKVPSGTPDSNSTSITNTGPDGSTGPEVPPQTTQPPPPPPPPSPLMTKVPYLYGHREPEAGQLVHDAKLLEGVGDNDGTGEVIWQDPAPGEPAEVGTVVYVRHNPALPPVLVWLLWFAGLSVGTAGGLIIYRLAKHAKIRAMTTELEPLPDKGRLWVSTLPKVQLELRGRPGNGAVTVQRSAAVEKVERGIRP